MGNGVKIPWVSGSTYHGNGGVKYHGHGGGGQIPWVGVKALGKWVFIPWVGDRYTMGRGSIYHGMGSIYHG